MPTILFNFKDWLGGELLDAIAQVTPLTARNVNGVLRLPDEFWVPEGESRNLLAGDYKCVLSSNSYVVHGSFSVSGNASLADIFVEDLTSAPIPDLIPPSRVSGLQSILNFKVDDDDPRLDLTVTPRFNFSYGDASPALVGNFTGTILSCRLVVTQAFNGSGVSLQIGTNATPGLLMTTSQNSPYEAGEYETSPRIVLQEPTSLYLKIDASIGTSQGAGFLIIETTGSGGDPAPVPSDIAAHEAKPNPHPQYVLTTDPRLSGSGSPSAHDHEILEVNGLSAALDGKANTSDLTNSDRLRSVPIQDLPPVDEQLYRYSTSNNRWEPVTLNPIKLTYGIPGTYTANIPPTAKRAILRTLGGGGGGASGRVGAASTARAGGTGAQGAGYSEIEVTIAELIAAYGAITPTSLSITVGRGGLGGTSVSTSDTNGNPGQNGTDSTISFNGTRILRACGGAGGVGGTNVTNTAGIGSGFFNGSGLVTGGGAGNNSISAVPPFGESLGSGCAGAGSAAGGSISTGNTAFNGGSGGLADRRNVANSWRTGGTASQNTTNGGAGLDGILEIGSFSGSAGGGGGASVGGNGGKGGDGSRGSAGGGGGAATNGSSSGAGGDGGNGYVEVTFYFF